MSSKKDSDGKVEQKPHVTVNIEKPTLVNESRNDETADADLLHRTVEDAGRWAFGTVFVELWVLNDERTNLIRPESGWWIDPAFYFSNTTNGANLIREPPPLSPGVGLAGVLWSDSIGATGGTQKKKQGGPATPQSVHRRVAWRQIEAIANDPMQAHNARLKKIAASGLGLAAAVSFNFRNRRGIVVYMARANARPKKLQSPANEAYLLGAADLIGCAWALRIPRRAVVAEGNSEFKRVVRLVREKIVKTKRDGLHLASIVEEAQKSHVPEKEPLEDVQPFSCGERNKEAARGAITTVVAASKKVRGGNSEPPPLFDWYQTVYTFVGVFVSLLTLTQFNSYVGKVHGSEYTLIMAPLAAVLTLLYALTAAPPSQPRQVLTAQAVGMSIAILFKYIPVERMAVYMRQSLSTSVAIAFMVKLGITHPPAAALTFVFASSVSFGWGNMLFVLVGDVIMLSIATIILNLNEKRQYPTFWGLGFIMDCFCPDDGKYDDA